MLIPILNGLLRVKDVPVTWLLFLLNLAVFIGSALPSRHSQATINDYLEDTQFIQLQGRLYTQFVLREADEHSPLLSRLAEKAQKGDPEKLKLMGTLAIRSAPFMENGVQQNYRGDQVEIERWREKIREIRLNQDRHPSYVLGLTAEEMDLTHWVSYMFVHSGEMHFLGNMFFLLIFGTMLEPLIGGLALMIVYLLSGMVGAGAFLLLSGPTAAPLIGASGSISGLMGLFCIFYWKTPVRFVYFLLPSANYVGLIYLPAWVVFLMFGLSDLAGYWGAINDFGGVAYAAHLGGEAAALLIGATVYLIRFRRSPQIAPEAPKVPVGRPISIAELVNQLKAS